MPLGLTQFKWRFSSAPTPTTDKSSRRICLRRSDGGSGQDSSDGGSGRAASASAGGDGADLRVELRRLFDSFAASGLAGPLSAEAEGVAAAGEGGRELGREQADPEAEEDKDEKELAALLRWAASFPMAKLKRIQRDPRSALQTAE